MALLGLGEVMGGYFVGIVRDKFGNSHAYILQAVLLALAVVLVVIFNEENKFGPMAYVMIYVWGLHDSGVNTLIRSILGFEFDSQSTPFCVFNFVQSLFIFVVQIVNSAIFEEGISVETEVRRISIYIMSVGAFGVLSVLMMLKFSFRDDQ